MKNVFEQKWPNFFFSKVSKGDYVLVKCTDEDPYSLAIYKTLDLQNNKTQEELIWSSSNQWNAEASNKIDEEYEDIIKLNELRFKRRDIPSKIFQVSEINDRYMTVVGPHKVVYSFDRFFIMIEQGSIYLVFDQVDSNFKLPTIWRKNKDNEHCINGCGPTMPCNWGFGSSNARICPKCNR